MNLTKFSIKRPVAVVIVILALIIFGAMSVLSTPIELTPEMELPMFIISTTYPGAGPEEVEDMVTRPVEDAVSTLEGLKNIQSVSQENYSMVMLELEYGTNMDVTHMTLQERLNMYVNALPESASSPVIMEISMDMMPTVIFSVTGPDSINLLQYAEQELQPQFERLSGVAQVQVSGGTQDYISVELIPERLSQFGLDLATISSTIASADFNYPAGNIERGDQSLILRGGADFNDASLLGNIPITLRTGDIIHLSDVANITEATRPESSISRYNGENVINLSVTKRQSASTVDVAQSAVEVMNEINAQGTGVQLTVISDSGEAILDSINSVVQSLILGAAISMVVLFLFLGDIKASLIIATSMPLSVLATLVIMSFAGISINLLSMGGLVVGVGMMVDNSIVVLDSCFKQKGERPSFREAALEGTRLVTTSVVASTVTTVVVFLPISMMEGLSGQIFKDAGYTIVISLLASLISAITLVPLLFCRIQPRERTNNPVARGLKRVEAAYGRLITRSFRHKGLVVMIAVVLLIGSFCMLPVIGMELMPAMDQGQISIYVEGKPGLKLDQMAEYLDEIEAVVASHPDVESYSVSSSGSSSGRSMAGADSGSVSVYLRDDRELSTGELVEFFRQETSHLVGCSVEVSSASSYSMGGSSEATVNITGENLDELEEASKQVEELMYQNPDVVNVTSSLSSGSPQAEIKVDPLKASAYGLTPAGIMNTVSTLVQGQNATTLRQNGEDYDVWVEYPEGEYTTIDQIQNMMLTTAAGQQVPLSSVATIEYSNAPQSLTRYNGEYLVTITGQIRATAGAGVANDITRQVNQMEMIDGVSIYMGGDVEMMYEEFAALLQALFTAVVLVFMVMAVQFNSMRYSIIVMISVPFSLIGAFLALLLCGFTLNMTSLIGFIQLVGIVVNNAIVLIDYANILQEEQGMGIEESLSYSGRTRLRPILMTTLTTVLSMLPMAIGIGGDVEMMQSMAVVIIGGLTSSTILTLVLIPVFYSLISKKEKKPKEPKKGWFGRARSGEGTPAKERPATQI